MNYYSRASNENGASSVFKKILSESMPRSGNDNNVRSVFRKLLSASIPISRKQNGSSSVFLINYYLLFPVLVMKMVLGLHLKPYDQLVLVSSNNENGAMYKFLKLLSASIPRGRYENRAESVF